MATTGWTRKNTLTLIRSTKEFHFLWRSNIYRDSRYRPSIKIAMNKLMLILKRPWLDITRKISLLRCKYKRIANVPLQQRNWVYFEEMSHHFKPKKETEVHFFSFKTNIFENDHKDRCVQRASTSSNIGQRRQIRPGLSICSKWPTPKEPLTSAITTDDLRMSTAAHDVDGAFIDDESESKMQVNESNLVFELSNREGLFSDKILSHHLTFTRHFLAFDRICLHFL